MNKRIYSIFLVLFTSSFACSTAAQTYSYDIEQRRLDELRLAEQARYNQQQTEDINTALFRAQLLEQQKQLLEQQKQLQVEAEQQQRAQDDAKMVQSYNENQQRIEHESALSNSVAGGDAFDKAVSELKPFDHLDGLRESMKASDDNYQQTQRELQAQQSQERQAFQAQQSQAQQAFQAQLFAIQNQQVPAQTANPPQLQVIVSQPPTYPSQSKNNTYSSFLLLAFGIAIGVFFISVTQKKK
jgi:hypothetical protein